MSSDHHPTKPNSMAAPDDPRQTAQAEDSSSVNAQLPSLKEYTKARSASSNDCAWLHELVSSNAISAGKVGPRYLVRVYYKETRDASTTTPKDFGTGSFALLDLKHCLASKHVHAVILCHRDSSRVDPEILDLLWTKFKLEVSFMRHHFDYKEFRDETCCPGMIRNRLEEEDGHIEDSWTFGGRWNPIRLPSETRASILRLSVDSECLSVCCRGGIGKSGFYRMSDDIGRITAEIVIALVRSKAVYQVPLSSWERRNGRERRSYPCTVDLYAAITDTPSISYEFPSDSSEFSCGIVHFYARLLVLRCYEDYSLRHDTQPIELDESDRVASRNHPHIVAMHHRRLELVKLKQNLSGYLGPLAPEHKSVAVRKGSDSAEDPYRRKLQGLLTDVEMLLSLYDNIMRIYEWHIHEIDSDYKGELASEQLEEARESKATAISLGKLSNLAFLYLPVNFVCAMLGMNLSIYGQGEVPVWVFLVLVVFFSLLTYLPVFLPKIDERRVRLYRVAYHLALRSVPAGFWFLAFSLTHSYGQNFEIMNSGLAQVFLGYTGPRTKGWMEGRNDNFFERATWGSQAFWKGKVKKIFLAVEELNSNSEPTELTV